VICERVRRQLGVYRELDRVERRAVAQHLAACPSCRAAWQEEQQARAVIVGVPRLEPPRGLEGRLLAIPATAGTARPGHPVMPWFAVTGVLLLLFGAGFVQLTSGRSAPPVTNGAARVTSPETQAIGSGPIVRQIAPSMLLDKISRDEQAAVMLAQHTAPFTAVSVAARSVSAARAAEPPANAAPAPLTVDPGAGAPGPGRGLGAGVHGEEDDEAGGKRATRTPVPPTEAAPLPSPTVCVDIKVVAFADLVGGDSPDCPGCDGQWTPEDEAAAAAAGVVVPTWLATLYDLADPDTSTSTIDEKWLIVDGGQASYTFKVCDESFPIRVELSAPSTVDWFVCPLLGTLEQEVTSADITEVRFPMTLGCPAPTPPPSATALTPPEDPAADPTAPAPTDTPEPPAATPPGSDDPQP
jgi:hypothetical protein